MREIKFRAWDNLQGGKFEYWNAETNKHDGIFWEMIKHQSFEKPQQFTGLLDKNGKEIYEGDIIIHYARERIDDFNIIVEWKICNEYGNPQWNISSFDCDHEEIIGNIYENPELLEQKRTQWKN